MYFTGLRYGKVSLPRVARVPEYVIVIDQTENLDHGNSTLWF